MNFQSELWKTIKQAEILDIEKYCLNVLFKYSPNEDIENIMNIYLDDFFNTSQYTTIVIDDYDETAKTKKRLIKNLISVIRTCREELKQTTETNSILNDIIVYFNFYYKGVPECHQAIIDSIK